MSSCTSSSTSVVLFCGGRGSASLIKAMLRWPDLSLTLVVNAYDDGLSTGALRDFVPGMLGPSDFRKNISYLLDLNSNEQYAMQGLLEYRLSAEGAGPEVEALEHFSSSRRPKEVPGRLGEMLSALDEDLLEKVRGLLATFFVYAREAPTPFAFEDCSFGNLIFTGAYLEEGGFNPATDRLVKLVGARARLLNVSVGEERHLIALKADGTLLATEAAMVGRQSPVPIVDYFFVERPIPASEWAQVAGASREEQIEFLENRSAKVELAPEAEQAIHDADVIVFGPGTQHSSLLPSYRIASDALLRAPAQLKLFVANLRQDHDIQGLGLTDLLDRALLSMGDVDNEHGVITHVLFNEASRWAEHGVTLDESLLAPDGTYRGATVLRGCFASPTHPEVHSGHHFVQTLHRLRSEVVRHDGLPSVEVYVDLTTRTLALDGLLQEFLDIDWLERFQSVRLSVNSLPVPSTYDGDRLTLRSTSFATTFSEVAALIDWLEHGSAQFLVTLTGDGEYRLEDVIGAVELLASGPSGVLFGSRNQSRLQFRSSHRAERGEGKLLYATSFAGVFVVSALLGARFGVVLSDPLSGFRVYERSQVETVLRRALRARGLRTPVSVTRALLRAGVEIAEMPIAYRTFNGFTQPTLRLTRGARDLTGLLW